jgi:hypothetical protein
LQKFEAVFEPSKLEENSRFLPHRKATFRIDGQGLIKKLECISEPTIFGGKNRFPLVELGAVGENLAGAGKLGSGSVEPTIVEERLDVGEKVLQFFESLNHEKVGHDSP